MAVNQSYVPAQKWGRLLGSKDSYPKKRVNLAQMNLLTSQSQTNSSHKINPDYGSVLEETMLGDASTFKPTCFNWEFSSEIWNWSEINIDDMCIFTVATETVVSDDAEPYFFDKYQ